MTYRTKKKEADYFILEETEDVENRREFHDEATEGSGSVQDHPPEEVTGETRIWSQVVACVGASLGQLGSGAVSGWTGVVLPSIQKEFSPTTAEVACIVSMMALGSLIGGVLVSPLMDAVGRRTTLLMVAPILIVSWTILGLAPNVATIMVGRGLGGLAQGVVTFTSQVYTSEACESHLRGKLSSLPTLLLTAGNLLATISGAFLPWRLSCLICGSISLPMVPILLKVPESPYWLLMKGRRDAAEASLRWLWGGQCDLRLKLRSMEEKLESAGTKISLSELWKPQTRTPLMMATYLMVSQQLLGVNIITAYIATILDLLGQPDPHICATYIGLTQFVFTAISLLLVDHLGRRLLLVTSSVIVGAFIMGMGGYQRAREEERSLGWEWLPLPLMLTVVGGYCVGFRSVPIILVSELFNTRIRSTALAICSLTNKGVKTVVLQAFPFIVTGVGLSTVFFVHGIINLVSGLVILLWIPETKNKSLEKIQDFFEVRTAPGSRGSVSFGAISDHPSQQTDPTIIQKEHSLLLPKLQDIDQYPLHTYDTSVPTPRKTIASPTTSQENKN